MDSIEYLKKITSAHITRHKYMAWLKELLDMLCELGAVFEGMDSSFSIETASGGQLDIIGATVGADRELLSAPTDEDYRRLIYAKIMRNMWDGTNENLTGLWNILYPSLGMTYLDNQDMTASFIISGSVSDFLLNLIPRGQLIPRPMGVLYNVRNLLPEIIGQNNLYSGVGLYSVSMHTLGTVELPDFDDVSICADGLGNLLMDGFGVILGL